MAEPTSEGLTFEKVWAMFQETDKRLQETREETDRLFRETEAQMKETDRKIKEVSEEGKKTYRAVKETSRIVGDLGNKFGKLSEYLVVPNMVEKFNALGYEVRRTGRNIVLHSPDKKILTEVDILLENGTVAIVVEVKSDLSEAHVAQHAERMEKLRRYWDEHNDTRRLIGAVAGAIMGDKVKTIAIEMGFYVIVQSGDTVKIDAPEGFTPKMW
jgi:hypothetical protein